MEVVAAQAEPLPVGRDLTHKIAYLRPLHSPVRRSVVTLDDQLAYFHVDVFGRAHDHRKKLLGAFLVRRESGCGIMIDVVIGQYVVQLVCIAFRPCVIQGSKCLLSIRHPQPPRPRRNSQSDATTGEAGPTMADDKALWWS